MSMKCPKCGKQARCFDSRAAPKGATRRRYRCTGECKQLWSTLEVFCHFGDKRQQSLAGTIERKYMVKAKRNLRKQLNELLGGVMTVKERLDKLAYELIYCKCGGGRRSLNVADVLASFQRAIYVHELEKRVDGTAPETSTVARQNEQVAVAAPDQGSVRNATDDYFETNCAGAKCIATTTGCQKGHCQLKNFNPATGQFTLMSDQGSVRNATEDMRERCARVVKDRIQKVMNGERSGGEIAHLEDVLIAIRALPDQKD